MRLIPKSWHTRWVGYEYDRHNGPDFMYVDRLLMLYLWRYSLGFGLTTNYHPCIGLSLHLANIDRRSLDLTVEFGLSYRDFTKPEVDLDDELDASSR